MIHYAVWYWLEEINDALVPGPGQLVGFGKRDVFGPIDLIPIIGPVRKLHKVSKVWKHRRKVKQGVYWGLNLAADVFAVKEGVEWFDNQYRSFSEQSSSVARSGNAVGPGGGTLPGSQKKKITYTGQSGRRTNGNAPPPWVPCTRWSKMGRRCYLRKGHRGRHRFP